MPEVGGKSEARKEVSEKRCNITCEEVMVIFLSPGDKCCKEKRISVCDGQKNVEDFW